MTILPVSLMFAVALGASAGACAGSGVESVYTGLAGKSCKKTIVEKTSGAFVLTCPGVGKFTLQVLDDDERSSINIVSPQRQVFELGYWDVVTHGFSSLGKTAEWRVDRVDGNVVPLALIVRVNGTDQSDPAHPKRVPLLAVAQIRKGGACVVKTVDGRSALANAEARAIADRPDQPCLAIGPPNKR